jgi:molecular chaperone Hsp33
VVHVVSPSAGAVTPEVDRCQSFVLADGAFRGRFVKLTHSVTTIIERHADPQEVSELLCEAMVAAVALAGCIKYDGVFTLQAQGQGPVHTLVADVTSSGEVRGCAKFDVEKLASELDRGKPDHLAAHLLGAGHLAFTVDQGPDTERYQGIVELIGGSIADSVHNYFRQSEQLSSALLIAVAPPEAGVSAQWRASALVIQRMPDIGGQPVFSSEEAEDAWRTAVILMGSATKKELLDAALPPETLLHRLFATIGVRALPPKPIVFGCRCSRQRTERILASFPVEEVKSYAEDGVVRMTCEFCRTDYVFSATEIDALAALNRSADEEGR